MADPKREELKVQQRKAILAAVVSPDSHLEKEHALDELRGLVKTAGVNVVGELVQRMHQVIQITLNQHGPQGNSDDGLELGACFIHADMDKMTFAGARFPLFIVVDDEVREIKSTRKGIGYRGIAQTQAFDEIEIELKPGMAFYMSSDGFLEQVGGPKRRMFGKKRFKALLKELQALPLNAQKERFMQALHDHQGPEPRRDDVAVLAFRV